MIQPRSLALTGVPRTSMIAFAAVLPTAWSRARRSSSAGSHSSASARAGTRSSGNLLVTEIEQADLPDPAARKAAMAEVVRLNKLLDQLAKPVRWSFPQWRLKGD